MSSGNVVEAGILLVAAIVVAPLAVLSLFLFLRDRR